MSAGPKDQHWLPSAYLKFFAINGEIKGRNSRVFVTTRDTEVDKKVSKTAVARYTYSRANPELDHEFNEMENDYPVLIEKLHAGQMLTKREELSLMLIMFDFHHRNIAYDNRSSKERFGIYQELSKEWFRQVLPSSVAADDLQAYCDYFSKCWELHTVSPVSTEKFITSDHPSIILTDPADSKPIASLLPVAPNMMLVCFDIQKLQFTGDNITDDALGVLNGIQVARCISEIYSDHQIKDQLEWPKVVKLFDRPNPDRWIDDNKYRPDYYCISSNFFPRLTFLSKSNPS